MAQELSIHERKIRKESIDLNLISEEELLNTRICDLPLTLKGTWLDVCIQHLYFELEGKGLCFFPLCYLAEEWLTPVNEPVIGIPFYLAHPTLIKLEKKMMLEAEGDTKEWCMKLLRHETGHAISYAYQLHKKRKWKEIFGSSSQEYSETYRFRPYSKNYVKHLDGFYAQIHPDEDFVETFAVWLTPNIDWRKQYQGWKVLDKLLYVDQLMKSIQGQPANIKKVHKYWNQKLLRITLKSFYKKKRRFRAEDFPDFHDPSLRRIFTAKKEDNKNTVLAKDLIKKYRRYFLNEISVWTGERKYVINNLLKTFYKRCQQQKLTVQEDEAVIVLRISSYLTTLIMNYLYTGWYRGDKLKRKK